MPGSGKSHLAEAVRVAIGTAVVRTDEVRSILFPVPTFAPSESAAVYLACFATVRALLRDGHAVVFDGTNGRQSGRRRLARIAREEGAGHVSVLVRAAPEVVRARIVRRTAGEAPAFGSGAGIEVYERMAQSEDYGGRFGMVVDASGEIASAVARIVAVIGETESIDGIGWRSVRAGRKGKGQ